MTIGIDFGGTSSKATLLGEDGVILATSTKEYPTYCPLQGQAEQDVNDFYEAFIFNTKAVLAKAGVSGKDIEAIALDSATHMAVLTDEDDKPLRRMIHWSDSRSTEEAKWLKNNKADVLAAHTLNSVSAAWTLPQLLWLKKHEPETMEKVHRIYFAKDYIRHLITGDFLTDYIEAMGAMLCDDFTQKWSPELCALAGIDAAMLPEIRSPMDMAGYVLPKAAEETGLSTGTKVIIGATDTALEVYASGAVLPGFATVKIASAGRICPITDQPVHSFQFYNYRHIVPGLWYPGTGTRSCASSFKWFRDTLGEGEVRRAAEMNVDPYHLLDEEAEKVPPGSDGLFFHPYLLGETTPYFDDSLRASFTGIRMHNTIGYFSRAVMEGTAYSLRDSLEVILAQGIGVKEFRIIGGGAKSPLWSSILCDIMNVPLTRTEQNDSSLGSAMLAALAVGIFDSATDSVDRCVRISGRIEPNDKNVAIYEKGFQTYRDICSSLSGVYHKMS